MHFNRDERQYIDDCLLYNTLQIKTLEKYTPDVPITQSSHPINQ